MDLSDGDIDNMKSMMNPDMINMMKGMDLN